MEVDDDGYDSVTEDEDEEMDLDAKRKTPARARETSPPEQALVDDGWITAEAMQHRSDDDKSGKESPLVSDAEASETEDDDEGPEPVVRGGGSGPSSFSDLKVRGV